MNECTSIVLTYGLFCFTDFVPSEETRSDIGYCYIVVSCAYISVHLIVLGIETVYRVKLVCKKYHCIKSSLNARRVEISLLSIEKDESKKQLDEEAPQDPSRNI